MSESAMASGKIEALAALVGSTQAELKKLDEDIISQSTSLQSANFDGKGILQKEINNTRRLLEQGKPAPQPSPDQEQPIQPVQAVPVQTPVPVPQQTPISSHAPAPASYGGELTIVLQKLVSIENEIKGLNERIDAIEYFDKKVVDSLTRGLQNKVKQVTIKLDESNRKQQK